MCRTGAGEINELGSLYEASDGILFDETDNELLVNELLVAEANVELL